MQTGRNATTNGKPRSMIKRGLASLIAVFFGFLLVLGQAPSANDHSSDNRVEGNLLHPSVHHLFLCATQPRHIPFESAPVPWEPKSADKEGETSDNFDDDDGKFFTRSSLRLQVDIAATKRELSQQSLSSANDERVPLFVLHHSWKTFIHEFPCFPIES